MFFWIYTSFIETFFLSLNSKKPCWDVPREGLQHEAIENEREYYENFEQQEILKKKAAIQSKINEKRIDEMHLTQAQLREKFIGVNQFLKECTKKTKRSEVQITEQKTQQEVLSDEIEAMRRDTIELSIFEKKFREIVEEFQPYVNVFNEVIAQSEYESFEDLINHCDSLMLAQVEIAEREQELIKGIELVRQKMVDSTAKAAQRIIELNDELAELERCYSQAKSETFKWENTLSTAKDYITENEKQTITLVDSIQHLYELLAKRNDEKTKLKKFDVGAQLDYIRDEIEILEDIIKRAHHKMAKEGQSMLGEGSNRFPNVADKGSNLSD
ncbi:unnamed protein product [Chironomus riparius]|uniref:DUF4200 domain-containing protein n=1 Tax=Chironomus riparius TaxID=315576 RepID=A0A9P0IR74_9DIPT|nr:unnamed protein product [Chironomus riparius]